ncbi:MAG: biopolymer transporter ExbD [Myxococcota bacterium]
MAGGISGEGGEDEPIADINITPFVDVVLVLLVVVMITSTQIVRAQLQVDLPKAASGQDAVPSTLNLILTLEGALLLDGRPIERDALPERINALRMEDPELQAVIAADQGVAYGRVVELIDLVKQNGINKFALNIERSASE